LFRENLRERIFYRRRRRRRRVSTSDIVALIVFTFAELVVSTERVLGILVTAMR
jgi:hypothetical protein